MNFGQALELLKEGKCVGRSGWNGRGMSIYLNKGSIPGDITPGMGMIESINFSLFEIGDNNTVTRLPNINMCAATGSTVTGWLASQTDMLAEDWEAVA